MSTFSFRTILSLLLIGVLFTPVAPAKAQWVTWDPGNNIANFGDWITNIFSSVSEESTAVTSALTEGSTGSLFTKEYILDQIAFILAKEALQSVIDEVIDFSGSGYDGAPAFVTNIRSHMLALGDLVADDFINQFLSEGMIDSPFRNTISSSLRGEYYRSTGPNAYFNVNRYTLDQFSDDPEAFLRGDFGRGGIEAWIQTWRNPQNNPFGAYERANSELSRRIISAQTDRSSELDRNSGFLNYCEDPPADASEGEETAETEGEATSLQAPATGGGPKCQTKTLGSTLNAALEKSIGAPIDQYVEADELNEVMTALVQALVTSVFEEGITGLAEGEGTRNRPVGGATDIINTMLGRARDIRGKIVQYQADWQKIGAKAQEASQRCPTDPLVQSTVSKAAAAAVKVVDALPALDAVIQKLLTLQSGEVLSDELQEVTTEYNSLSSSGRLPTPAELSEAKLGAVDTPPPNPEVDLRGQVTGSLYDQMENAVTTGVCPTPPPTTT